ncbi:MAG: FAD-binding oxidoreductase [Thermodesulfobacteriota bacterium]
MPQNGALENIVGKKNVINAPALLEEYSSDSSFVSKVRPRCVVKPTSAAQVQDIIKWANETMTPLVPISSGPLHFRGDTVPRLGGSVIVDMSGMKKIMRIDARNRVAWIEPGVTFGELNAELSRAGLTTYMPLCPRSSKSVLTSILERDPITMPAHHWDCTDPMLCGEVIFGTGDKMRTGEAAGPGTLEEQWAIGKAHMTPFGLAQFDETKLISGAQGTIGILTWTSLKCRFLSKFSRLFLVPSEQITLLLDLSSQLLRVRQCDHCFILNGLNLACLLGQTPDEIRSLGGTLPPWVLVVSFEGCGELPEEKVAWQEADFRKMASRAGVSGKKRLPGVDGETLTDALSKPSLEPYWKLKLKGACSDLFFLTTLDRTPVFIDSVISMSGKKRFSQKDIGVYIQPIVQGTSCHCEFDLYYDPEDAAALESAKWFTAEGAAILANMGGFFSRPYGPWSKIAYNHAGVTAQVLKKLKNIFDPKAVLNPGNLCF